MALAVFSLPYRFLPMRVPRDIQPNAHQKLSRPLQLGSGSGPTTSRGVMSALCSLSPAHAHLNLLSEMVTAHQRVANNISRLFPHTQERKTHRNDIFCTQFLDEPVTTQKVKGWPAPSKSHTLARHGGGLPQTKHLRGRRTGESLKLACTTQEN